MAGETTTKNTDSNTLTAQAETAVMLGKPAATWKTIVTHIASGAALVFGTASVAVGVITLVKGHKAFGKRFEEALKLNMPEDMQGGKIEQSAQAAVKQIQKWGKKVVNVSGGTLIAGGVLGDLAGKAAWDTASSATRTRNYLKLHEQLSEKQVGTSY